MTTIVDTDGDDLDDRLTGTDELGKSDLRDIAERVENIRLVKLPIPALEKIYNDIQKDMDLVINKAKI